MDQQTAGFLDWWQHLPSRMDPILFQVGPLKLHYYGLMYLIAFGLSYWLVLRRIKHEERFQITPDHAEGLTTFMILGVILGGRLGYVIFYNLFYYVRHPLEIFLPFSFEGGFHFTGISGMSYHGGLLGVMIAAWWYAKKNNLSLLEISDLYAPVVPLGYTFGRIGNFINGELYGRTTDLAVGMYFPKSPTATLRHPSQLYEAFFEGVFLFAIMWHLRDRVETKGAMLSFYLIGYGGFRFMIEFVREPDAHIGLIRGWLTVGQVLCAAMVGAGVGIYLYLRKREAGVAPSHAGA